MARLSPVVTRSCMQCSAEVVSPRNKIPMCCACLDALRKRSPPQTVAVQFYVMLTPEWVHVLPGVETGEWTSLPAREMPEGRLKDILRALGVVVSEDE